MKSSPFRFLLLTLAGITLFSHANGWGNDVVVGPFTPSAQHAMTAKQSGELFVAFPGVGITGPNLVSFFNSTDNGVTWNLLPLGGLPVNAPVLKTKMVTTGNDSVYCVFLQGNAIYVFNVESGVLGQFTQSTAADFDVAASFTGNWIYLYVDELTTNSIRRYGTNTGGLTWTGNTAQVTGSGARPRVSFFANRLILNYYGALSPVDVTRSKIVAAFYDETAPGTLTAGTFQDVVTDTTIKHLQFETVLTGSYAWFFYTEGDAMQVIRCRHSSDNGATYQPVFNVAGNINVNSWWFGTARYADATGYGVHFTCISDSLSPVIPGYTKLLYMTASSTSPSPLTVPAAPFNTYNDNGVMFSSNNDQPLMLTYSFNGVSETGVTWMGDASSGGPWMYFDRLSATTGIAAPPDGIAALSVFPSPATTQITVAFASTPQGIPEIEITDLQGRIIYRGAVMDQVGMEQKTIRIPVESWPSGNYFVTVKAGRHASTAIFEHARIE